VPNIYVIAGCNGAGKTTASLTILPEILNCKEFVNAYAIAAGLSPFNPEGAAFESGRIMLNRIRQLMSEQNDFAFETTLSTKSYISLLKSSKEKGYKITLIFFWLKNVELAKGRVLTRVKMGGHFIPDDILERRYFRGLRNLFNHFITLSDVWMIYDNSTFEIQLISKGLSDIESEIIDQDKFNQIKNYAK